MKTLQGGGATIITRKKDMTRAGGDRLKISVMTFMDDPYTFLLSPKEQILTVLLKLMKLETLKRSKYLYDFQH